MFAAFAHCYHHHDCRHTLRKVKRGGKELLTTVKPDPVSKKRTAAITIEAQRRYMSLIEKTREDLQAKSVGGEEGRLLYNTPPPSLPFCCLLMNHYFSQGLGTKT